MKFRIMAVLLFFTSLFLFGESYFSEYLEARLYSLIMEVYTIPESNPIHVEVNERIYDEFLDLLHYYESYDYQEINQRAMKVFQTFHNQVSMGMLEDSPDIRRQSVRTAMSFSSLAICSYANCSYYLDLAKRALWDPQVSQEQQYLLADVYTCQFMVNIYILNLQDELYSLSSIRITLDEFFDFYDSYQGPSAKMIEMNQLLREIHGELPPNLK